MHHYHCDTQSICKALGGTIQDSTKVEDIIVSGKEETTVHTSNGNYRCKKLVLCPGPWAQDLLSKVGLNVSMQVNPLLLIIEHEKGYNDYIYW